MEIWIALGVGLTLVVGIGVGLVLRSRKSAAPKGDVEKVSATPVSSPAPITEKTGGKDRDEVAAVGVPVSEAPVKLSTGISQVPKVPEKKIEGKLAKTRSFLRSRLEKLWGAGQDGTLSVREWDSLEESLLEADVGVSTTRVLLEKVKGRSKEGKSLLHLMREECLSLFGPGTSDFSIPVDVKPYVISIVGINGVGKTTTIGKLAYRLKSEGKTVLLGAADTFRAAAISQLKIWADRTESQFVGGNEGGDPGAVAFDAVTAGKARGVDVVLLDTAGRLHTKTSLMDELKKIHKVVKKVIPEAPHETWLILDGTLGQNSVQQAKEFQKTLELTGVVVTKLDGTAKGGAILAVTKELGIPVRFIGLGESMEDFVSFNPKQFVEAILGE